MRVAEETWLILKVSISKVDRREQYNHGYRAFKLSDPTDLMWRRSQDDNE